MSVELAEIVRILNDEGYAEPLTLVSTGSALAGSVPEQWRPILASDDAETRRLNALSLWSRAFLDLIPEFAQALRTELADVLVGHQDGEAVLVYAFEHFDGSERCVECWLGEDPASVGDVEPPFYDCLPQAVRSFYREVHAGFTATDRRSCGPRAPKYLSTLAEYLQFAEDDADLWEGQDIPWTRLLVVAITGTAYYCVSPDLPAGLAVQVYESEPDDPEGFFPLLDKLMMKNFE